MGVKKREFKPRTVQFVRSHYANCTIQFVYKGTSMSNAPLKTKVWKVRTDRTGYFGNWKLRADEGRKKERKKKKKMMMMMTTTCKHLAVLWNPNVHNPDHKRTIRLHVAISVQSMLSNVSVTSTLVLHMAPLPYNSAESDKCRMLQKNTGDGTPVC
jgi:hypothetical protein